MRPIWPVLKFVMAFKHKLNLLETFNNLISCSHRSCNNKAVCMMININLTLYEIFHSRVPSTFLKSVINLKVTCRLSWWMHCGTSLSQNNSWRVQMLRTSHFPPLSIYLFLWYARDGALYSLKSHLAYKCWRNSSACSKVGIYPSKE